MWPAAVVEISSCRIDRTPAHVSRGRRYVHRRDEQHVARLATVVESETFRYRRYAPRRSRRPVRTRKTTTISVRKTRDARKHTCTRILHIKKRVSVRLRVLRNRRVVRYYSGRANDRFHVYRDSSDEKNTIVRSELREQFTDLFPLITSVRHADAEFSRVLI